MHGDYYCAVTFVIAISLQACSPFQLPPRTVTPYTPQHVVPAINSFDATSKFPAAAFHEKSLRQPTACKAGDDGRGEGDGVDYSADPFTTFLGKFLPGEEKSNSPQAEDLVFNVGEAAKRRGMTASEMASAVDEGLRRNGWFVTGRVDASLFSESFFFSDPQVSLTGVGKYAEGVAKLFDQEESRCDVISTEADGEDIVVQWRLSGRINLPFKPPIKPYVVTTTFERDAEGLLSTQRDEFAIAGWDILLHAVFPGHPFGADPAPPVAPRGS